MPETFPRCPLGEVGVQPLAGNNQRRKQFSARDPSRNGLGGLRLDRHVAVRTELRAELYEEQPEKMIDLGDGGNGALATTAAGALLNGNRRRDAEYRVHVGTRRRLDELPGVRVERFEVPALSLGEENVECERGLARPADAGDDGEFVAWNLNVNGFEVVLARPANDDLVVGSVSHAGSRPV